MASWSKDKVLEFIDLYRSHESLWKIKSKEYSNRLIKERCYEKLIDFVKDFEPQANKELVLKKINNLKGNFRKELKNVEGSKLSGAGTDEDYHPKLWYFESLLFLKDQEIPRLACSSLGLHNDYTRDTTDSSSTFLQEEEQDSHVG
ncbi:sodium/hydrogen exchanger 3 [Elysia marginata]|uniref:Sodium/hydrogen exchanger 3 n=1 Tax=Elysia marginata TaxID=1093978 RepID=A0AAV4JBX3_9GAST|nr:sodium/hydrogen exchanger 3 [Elysia marginata]